MPNSQPRSASSGGLRPDSFPRQPPPTDIHYYLRGIRPAANLLPEPEPAPRTGEMWKGLAFLALFVSALALLVSIVATTLMAA